MTQFGRVSLGIGLIGVSVAVLAEDPIRVHKVNQDYLYADVSAGSFDADNGAEGNVTSVMVGYSGLFAEHWLVVADYEARFIRPDETTTEIYSFRPGVGYKWDLNDDWLIYSRARAGYLRTVTTEDDTDQQLSDSSDLIYGIDLGLSYSPIDKLELTALGELSRSDALDEEIVKLRADYYVTRRFALGGFYSYRNAGEYTSNEGGISMRYAY